MESTEGTTRTQCIWDEVAELCHGVGSGALSLAGSLEASRDVVTLQLCFSRGTWPALQLGLLVSSVGSLCPICALGTVVCKAGAHIASYLFTFLVLCNLFFHASVLAPPRNRLYLGLVSLVWVAGSLKGLAQEAFLGKG